MAEREPAASASPRYLDPGVQVVLASGNRGKLAELAAVLAPLAWSWRPQADFGVPEAPEDGLTFLENALAKARHAARHTGLPALADDSGLVVEALGGAPGIRSARYAGAGAGDAANNRKLLAALENAPDRRAHFHCTIVLLRQADDPDPLVASGRWHGRILDRPRGDGGFGYDPLFAPDDDERSAAELAPEVKNRVSHRGQALRALLAQLMPGGDEPAR